MGREDGRRCGRVGILVLVELHDALEVERDRGEDAEMPDVVTRAKEIEHLAGGGSGSGEGDDDRAMGRWA